MGSIRAGAPQGLILIPLLFLICINDVTDELKCSVKLFADYTAIFTVVDDASIATENTNHDLQFISLCALKWTVL